METPAHLEAVAKRVKLRLTAPHKGQIPFFAQE